MSLTKLCKNKSLSLAALLALCFFFSACGSREEREVIGTETEVWGYKGKAGKEPYLAARSLLSRLDKDAEAKSVVRFDRDYYDAIVLPATSISNQAKVRTVKGFVEEGGHVVLMIQNGTRNYDDFSQYSQYLGGWEEDPMEYANELLKDYGLQISENEEDTPEYTEGDDMSKVQSTAYEIPDAANIVLENALSDSLTVRMGGDYVVKRFSNQSFIEDEHYSDIFIDQGEVCRLVSRQLYTGAAGRITLVSDARILRNPFIGDKDHASFMAQLFEDDYSILFTTGRNLDFYELMWKYFPLFLLGLIFLVFVWVLGKVHRFGPTLQIVVEQPLNYLKSIDASGHFLWKHKREDYLISSLVEKAKKVSGLDIGTSPKYGETLQAVSDAVGLPAEEIENALAKVSISEPIAFIKTVQTLQTIIQHYE